MHDDCHDGRIKDRSLGRHSSPCWVTGDGTRVGQEAEERVEKNAETLLGFSRKGMVEEGWVCWLSLELCKTKH